MRIILGLFVCCMLLACEKPVNHQLTLYIGSVSDNGIEVCKIDTVTGKLSESRIVAKLKNTNYLHLNESGEFLFSVGQNANNDFIINSYKILEDDSLALLSSVSAIGEDPCFVELIENESILLVANYSSGTISYYNVDNGIISEGKSLSHHGSGPQKDRQESAHAHSIRYDKKTGKIYSADLGADRIYVYSLQNKELTLKDSIVSKPGAGPRHLDFHPTEEIMAVVNELNCSVTTYVLNSEGVYKNELKTLSLLPQGYEEFAKAADIHYSPDGKFLYASNRGFNALGIYRVDGKDIEFVDFQTEGINWPRNFNTEISNNFVVVANRDNNEIRVFKRDTSSGLLTNSRYSCNTEMPVCIKVKTK